MQKVDNAKQKVRRKLVAIEKKIAYWRRREKRDGEVPQLVTKDGTKGLTRLEHFENFAADLRRGSVPRALSRAHGTSASHL